MRAGHLEQVEASRRSLVTGDVSNGVELSPAELATVARLVNQHVAETLAVLESIEAADAVAFIVTKTVERAHGHDYAGKPHVLGAGNVTVMALPYEAAVYYRGRNNVPPPPETPPGTALVYVLHEVGTSVWGLLRTRGTKAAEKARRRVPKLLRRVGR